MPHTRQGLLDVEAGVVLLIVAGGAHTLDDAEGALVGDAVDGRLLETCRCPDVVVARPVADLALDVGHRVALLLRRRVGEAPLVTRARGVAGGAGLVVAAAGLQDHGKGAGVRRPAPLFVLLEVAVAAGVGADVDHARLELLQSARGASLHRDLIRIDISDIVELLEPWIRLPTSTAATEWLAKEPT